MNNLEQSEELLKTYFLLKNSKILILIIKHSLYAMEEILSKFSKGSFEEKLLFYKMNIESKYGFNVEFGRIMQQAYKILKEHKISPIEIAFKNKIAIYSEDYELTELNEEFAIKIIEKAKLFIEVTLTKFSNE